MRFAGPRMLRRHPILAVLHLLDGLRKEPERPPKAVVRVDATKGVSAKH
jgi:hypothetical protein